MKIIFKDRINSTNLYGKENIDFLDDATVIFTSCQTEGRGRLSRKWLSFESDNICASIVLKPEGDFSTLPISNLTQLLAVSIVRVLCRIGINANIKWPNDVVIIKNENDLSGEKICGILAETVTVSNKIKGIVIGFGLNVNAKTEELSMIDRPATSLFKETQKNYSSKALLDEILDEFFNQYNDFMEQGFSLINDEFLSCIKFIDKEITVNMPHKTLKGVARAITDDGAVLLEENKGLVTTITMGEIQC